MKTFGKVLAGICAILFVISGVTAITFFNIERRAFSSETQRTRARLSGHDPAIGLASAPVT